MTASTDFFADLERQLVDAARERPRRLRRARRRAAAATLATVALLAGGAGGIAALATSTHTDRRAAPAAPEPMPTTATPATPTVTVAVLNGTTTPGLARGVANRLAAARFAIGLVSNAADQAHPATTVEYARGTGVRTLLRVMKALGLRDRSAFRPLTAASRAIAGDRAQIVITVGDDQSTTPGAAAALAGVTATVLNATDVPGLASRVRKRLVAAGATVPAVAGGLGRHETRTQVLAARGHRREAARVAATLGLGDTAVGLVPDRISRDFGGHGVTVFVVAGRDAAG